MQIKIELKNIKFQYPKSSHPVLEIENLELAAENKSTLFLIGPSGAGKSTFLETLGLMNNVRLIAGDGSVFKLQVGEEVIDYLDRDVYHLKSRMRKRIRKDYFSFIFQYPALIPHYSVGDNLSILNNKWQESYEAVLEDLFDGAKVDLTKRTAEFSGGEQQRISFFRALLNERPILIGDEPFNNLDKINKGKLLKGMRHDPFVMLNIVSTHDESVISSGDLVLDFTKGRAETGPTILDQTNLINAI